MLKNLIHFLLLTTVISHNGYAFSINGDDLDLLDDEAMFGPSSQTFEYGLDLELSPEIACLVTQYSVHTYSELSILIDDYKKSKNADEFFPDEFSTNAQIMTDDEYNLLMQAFDNIASQTRWHGVALLDSSEENGWKIVLP